MSAEPIEFDVAVIGAGPAGCTAAIDAALAGASVAVVERQAFPRFQIGESMTGEAGRMVREWGLGDVVDAAGHIPKQGTYVYGSASAGFYIPVVGVDANGNRRPTSTWQVDRAHFDKTLLDFARDQGATVISGDATGVLLDGESVVSGVQATTQDGMQPVHARFTIDASGRGRFAQKQGITGPMDRGRYGHQVAFFTHLHGVDRGAPPESTNTRIFYAGPNRWAWLIPVTEDLTSIGLVQPTDYVRDRGESPDDFVRREMHELHPLLSELVAEATPARPVEAAHNFSYQVHDFSGPGWVAVGDAHRFVDPIFSLGIANAMLEAREATTRCLQAIDQDLSPEQAHRQLLRPFEAWAEGGVDIVQDLIDAFWGNPVGFGFLAHYKHHDDIVDLFAGRYYGIEEPSAGLRALRELAGSLEPAR